MVYPQPLSMVAPTMETISMPLRYTERTLEDGPGCRNRVPLNGMACPLLVAGDCGLHICQADLPD